jgi:hypothetical protein
LDFGSVVWKAGAVAGDDDFAVMYPTVEAPDGGGPTLTGQQRSVREALAREDTEVAQMYLGALWVLDQPGNPDRMAQAAHSLRQVIEKLGERFGAPLKTAGALGEKVRDLRLKWCKGDLPSVFEAGAASGALDPRFRSILGEVGKFFAWYDENEPSRREQVARFLAHTDPSRRRPPEPVEKRLTKRWLDVSGALSAIAHHGRNGSETRVRELLDRLNTLIVDALRPRTFERQDEIDGIVAEGEGST